MEFYNLNYSSSFYLCIENNSDYGNLFENKNKRKQTAKVDLYHLVLPEYL